MPRKSFIGAVVCLTLWVTGARRSEATTVSLAFDGAYLDIVPVQQMLSARGLHATFFANSAMVGTKDHLSLDQLLSLQMDGNEIGGATVYGLNLIKLDPMEQQREICADRSWLLANALQARSFAFPPSLKTDPTNSDAAVDLVMECGYNEGRKATLPACAGCSPAIPLPPADSFRLPVVDLNTALGDPAAYALDAGTSPDGWLIFVAHHLCDAATGCDSESISSSTLAGFLDWLVGRQAEGISVKTIGEVIDQPVKPAVAPQPPTPPGPDGALLQNGSLESDVDGDGIPDCWQAGGEGDNKFVIEHVADPHDGQWAEQIVISQLTTGARRLVSKQDLGQCAPPALVGHYYRVKAWVKFDGLVKLIAYTRGASGAWSYWSQSSDLAMSDTYQEVRWITPAIPEGSLGLSVGVTLDSLGTVTMDQISLEDLGTGTVTGGGCSTVPLGVGDGEPALLILLVCLGLGRRRRVR